MKIFLNAFIFWITISCYSYCDPVSDSKSEEEEADFYGSLQDSNKDGYQTVHDHGDNFRNKRSTLEQPREGIYESEVRVLGRVDNGEAKERVERASGDPNFSISETPIYPTTSYQHSISNDNDDSMTEMSTVDSSSNDETSSSTMKTTSLDSSSPEEKLRDNESDFGSGIEVESEEKLADEDDEESQSTSQTTVGEITLTSRSNTMDQVLWPSGTYGLVKPSSGCPESSGFVWNTGLRFYDTEDDGTENHKSSNFHLAGNVTEDGVTLEFCMKTKDVGLKRWPSGKYCIFQQGSLCPHGLKTGFVYWDDENRENKNFMDGSVPTGVYTDITKMYFCCSTNGNVRSAMVLPTQKPFYLFPYGSSTCQKVKNMKSTLEFVKFDEEDKGGIEKSAEGFYPYGILADEKDHIFYMCFYESQDEGDIPLESGRIVNSEKVAHSEKIIHEFMKSKDTEDTDEIAKEQESRTRNNQALPRLQTSTSHAIMIATGFVLTTVAILVGALLVISYFTKRWSRDLKRDRQNINSARQMKRREKEIKPEQNHSKMQRQTSQEQEKRERSNEIDFAGTETEQEEELVEDNFLPSDSQLKSGLEFLFLKQQKRKWLAKNNRNK